jgi:hypothetical protein
LQNPKSEYRNPKQISNIKCPNDKNKTIFALLHTPVV